MRGGSFHSDLAAAATYELRADPRAVFVERYRIPVREVGAVSTVWDAARYQSRHSYVFAHGAGVVEFVGASGR